ncbi:MAG: hypothetical protein HYX65_06780 [Gemmatimonadetes bacterium]|nr:hypothetical protein [Gemmatimonadota bacterium]
MRGRAVARCALVAAALVAASCTPRAVALAGAPVEPARLPAARLAPGSQQITFTWTYRDPDQFASGEGAARVAGPDSARVDLFLRGGLGSGFAIVLGDSIFSPGGSTLMRFLPPVSMFWAALGRLAVPPGDTTVRMEGTVLRADIRRGPAVMRVEFDGERLAWIENIERGGIVERVTRGARVLTYEHFVARRALSLTITRTQSVGPFDAAIWTH